MSQGKEQKKVKATEKLALLEQKYLATARRVGEMELILYNISRENDILKNALQLVHEKLDAVINLANEGKALSQENINEKVVLLKEQELKNKVDQMLEQGAIEAVEEVGENSLVVSREVDDDGKVVNPRLQFITGRLNEESLKHFLGKKSGDLVKMEEGKLGIEIAEIYNFVEQKLDPNNELPEESQESQEESAE